MVVEDGLLRLDRWYRGERGVALEACGRSCCQGESMQPAVFCGCDSAYRASVSPGLPPYHGHKSAHARLCRCRHIVWSPLLYSISSMHFFIFFLHEPQDQRSPCLRSIFYDLPTASATSLHRKTGTVVSEHRDGGLSEGPFAMHGFQRCPLCCPDRVYIHASHGDASQRHFSLPSDGTDTWDVCC